MPQLRVPRIPATLLCLALPLIAFAADPAAQDPKAFRVYVSNELSGDVTVIDGRTHRVIDSIEVGKRPRGIQVSSDGRMLFVATSGSPRMGPGADPERARSAVADKSADGIAVVDLLAGRRVKHLKVGSDPEELALSADGRHVIVANEDVGRASVWDIATGRRVAEAEVSGEPEGVALHPDGRSVYITCEEEGDIYVLRPDTAEILTHFQLGGRPRTVTFTPQGDRAYIPLETQAAIAVIDARKHAPIDRIAIPTPALLMDSALSPDGRELYVSTGRGAHVAVVDLEAKQVVTQIPVGTRPWGVALSPDGTLLFTANGPSNDVSVVDVRQRKEIARIKAGASPWGVTIGPVVQRKVN